MAAGRLIRDNQRETSFERAGAAGVTGRWPARWPPQGRPLGCPAPYTTRGHYDRAVPDCLFCGIAAGQIPATMVLDGKRVIAFRDINPQAPTHVLVVPRDHFPNVGELAAAG